MIVYNHFNYCTCHLPIVVQVYSQTLCFYNTDVGFPCTPFKWLTPFSIYLPLYLSSLGSRGMKMIPRQRNEISLCLVGIFYEKGKIFWDKKFGNAMMKVFIWSSLGWSQRVSDMLASWQGLISLETCAPFFKVVHLGEWNTRRFEGCGQNILDLKLFFLKSLFDWLLTLGSFSFTSLSDMIDHCTLGAWLCTHSILPVYLGYYFPLLKLFYLSKIFTSYLCNIIATKW